MSDKKRSEHDAVELERIPPTPASDLPAGKPEVPSSEADPASGGKLPRLEGFDPNFWDLIVA